MDADKYRDRHLSFHPLTNQGEELGHMGPQEEEPPLVPRAPTANSEG